MPALLRNLARMTDAVVAVDREQRVILWNHGAEELLGKSANEALGRPCYELLGGRDEVGTPICRAGCHTISAARREKPIPCAEMMTATRDGRQLWLAISHLVLSPGPRNPFALVHILRNINRRKAMEQLIQQISKVLAGLSTQELPLAGAPILPAQLTVRERQILKLLAGGAATPKVASQLHISHSTVRNHIQNILSKLGTHSRLEAVALAALHNLF